MRLAPGIVARDQPVTAVVRNERVAYADDGLLGIPGETGQYGQNGAAPDGVEEINGRREARDGILAQSGHGDRVLTDPGFLMLIEDALLWTARAGPVRDEFAIRP